MAHLFTPVTVPAPSGPGLTLRNRTVLAPMCQYSAEAEDGVPTDWHLVHLGAQAAGGFGLVIAEATAVSPEGRISNRDVGLWNDAQRDQWRRVVDFIHSQGAAAGVQLAHAGAKASTYGWLPQFLNNGLSGSIPTDGGGWQTVTSGSGAPFGDLAPARGLSEDEILASIQAWADAARRADEAGFDVVQIHAAHGYLIHQFLSPLANDRTDHWGGSFENRTRYVLEVAKAIRAVWPDHKPLAIRFSGTDWNEDGWTLEQTQQLARQLWDEGVTAFDLSSGGIGAIAITPAPGYQVTLAAGVRKALAGLTLNGHPAYVTAVGLITEAAQAESILVTGQADGISIGRAALVDPHWPASAARQLRVASDENPRAAQFWRAF
ncbi:NADH:flavin oxidoreductase/NADH oxidase [Aestuariimicrobium ganziense]|uniref:NADH:flavin oxidoreductase/NADH oxidase n=1 Tax=Aestuariimicrobium ganziense TaxID=2773677 RepID=UPI001942FAB3|nr:NADH:flavin oxidoreductase/NADH oxidase [Aestuariimicrobium ganziense]